MSRLRKKASAEQLETAGMMRWLLTYADMITLLLALFIILFSISTINRVKLQQLVHDISGGFNNTEAINNPPNGGSTGDRTGGGGNDANLTLINQQVRAYIRENKLDAKVETRIDRRGLVITLLTDKALYDSGSAELRPETKKLLDQINGALMRTKSDLRIEGNTDNVPIATSIYPTNWELSAARATGVTRYLVETDKLDPRRVSLAGYGEYRPRSRNDNDKGRQSNRRVDIVILNAANTAASQAEQQ